MNETKLLSCPFCNGEPRIEDDPGFGARIRCSGCPVRQVGVSRADAVDNWNRRGGFGHVAIAHALPAVPKDTQLYAERVRNVAERIEKGELGDVDRGVVLSLERRHLVVTELRLGHLELNGIAAALVSTLQAQQKVKKT